MVINFICLCARVWHLCGLFSYLYSNIFRRSALHIFREIFAGPESPKVAPSAPSTQATPSSPSFNTTVPAAPLPAADQQAEATFWREYLAGSTLLNLDRIATLNRLDDNVQMQKVKLPAHTTFMR